MTENSLYNEYKIEAAGPGSANYDGLRALWHDIFGDPPAYVDAFYDNFGEDIKGYAVTDRRGRVCSALTCYLCGSFEGQPVYVSYAVCTAEDRRGLGLGAMLTGYVRDEVLASGAVSLVSPANTALESYYEKLGYSRIFYAADCIVPAYDDSEEFEDVSEYDIDTGNDEGFKAVQPAMRFRRLPREEYGRYREEFLADRPHIELSGAMLKLIEAECGEDGGIFAVNNGDAVCAAYGIEDGALIMPELILNPLLEEMSPELDAEIAAAAARQTGAFETAYRRPGGARCQSMACGIRETEQNGCEAYFGFPID